MQDWCELRTSFAESRNLKLRDFLSFRHRPRAENVLGVPLEIILKGLLDRLVPVDNEVRSKEGHWFLVQARGIGRRSSPRIRGAPSPITDR